jgi:hypothetical protein
VYDHPVARSEQIYAGRVSLGDAEVEGQVWAAGTTALVYLADKTSDESIIGPMQDTEITQTASGQLVLMGTVDGQPVVWTAVEPTRVEGTWRKSMIQLDGQEVYAELVQQTNHGVTLKTTQQTYDLAGAKVRTLGGRSAQIVQADGTTLAMTLPKRGCGCSGGTT